MATHDTNPSEPPHLERSGMRTADIVFFVLAGVAPMGAVVALLSVSIALGNGPGVPGTYVVAAVVLALFSAGYVHMSRRITNVGGFYSYAREGIGRRAGGATAYVALVAYNAATIGIFAALAFFASQVAAGLGLSVSWQVCAVVAFVLVAVLAYFEVTLSAKVLGVALAAEVLTLLVFDVAVLVQHGFHGFSLHVFAPTAVLAGGLGISLMYAFGSFIGFEATALYGEEARNPRRSVPRATYISLAIIAVFYILTSWAAISSFGVGQVKGAAAKDPANFMFTAGGDALGNAFVDVMSVLVITSLFAAFLAFHCSTARYHVALARDGLLPRSLARTHPRYGSPVMASAWQLGLVAVITIGFTLAGQHPYLGLSTALFSLGVIGIVLLQGIAAASIVAFFLRHRQGEPLWGSVVAPALGGIGLVGGVVLMVINYPTLTQTHVAWVNSVPWALPIAAAVGAIAAARRSVADVSREDHTKTATRDQLASDLG